MELKDLLCSLHACFRLSLPALNTLSVGSFRSLSFSKMIFPDE